MLLLARSRVCLTTVNVCTLSDYAPYLDPDQRDRVEQVTTARTAEDACFTAAVAALTGMPEPIHWIDLQWRDAPLRLGIVTEDVLKTAIPSNDVNRLASDFSTLPDADVVLAPLALGGHIDHRLVRDAAVDAFAEKVVFYEDLPYASRMSPQEHATATALCVPFGWRKWSPRPASSAGTKQQLAMCYPSQIAPDVADEIETYASVMGQVERFYGTERSIRSLERALQTAATATDAMQT